MRRIAVSPKLYHLLLLLFLPLLATQCGAEEEPTFAEELPPAELRWITFDINSQVETLLADRFRQAHPEITFRREQDQWGHDYLDEQPLPDLMTATLDIQYLQASRQGKLADLTELWLEAGLEEKVFPNVQKLTTDADSGKQYMMPTSFAWAGIYYNKAIFAQYGLQPPQTWDEFLQICATLYNNGETPVAMTGSDSYSYLLWFDYFNLRINGAEYHRALLTGEERYDDPRIYSLLEMWRTLFEQEYVVARPQQMNDLSAVNAVIRGDNGMLRGEKAVMLLMDAYTITQTPQKFRDELDFFPFPIIDPSIPVAEPIGIAGYVIPANADHGLQAQNFLYSLTSLGAQEILATEALVNGATFAPVRGDLDETLLSEEMRKATAMLRDAPDVVPFTLQWMPNAMWSGFDIGYRRFLNEEYDPQVFIEALENARQDAVERGAFE